MAESDNDSFVFIEEINTNNLHLAQSILSNKSNAGTASMDGWSEISAPSHKSLPTKVMTSNSCFLRNTFNDAAYSGYCMIPAVVHDIFLSNSTTNEDNNHIHHHHHHKSNARNHSIGSVGSRVPFSWAEITKIQPFFHNQEGHKQPKVFEETPKIKTRYRFSASRCTKNKVELTQKAVHIITASDTYEHHEAMPSIPESDPCATKSDLGRRIRRAGKRGSRLKYPNGKRGTNKRNGKKKGPKRTR